MEGLSWTSKYAEARLNLLEFAQPGVSDNGPQDRRQIAQSYEGVVDGDGGVVIPPQKVCEVQHQHSWDREREKESDEIMKKGTWRRNGNRLLVFKKRGWGIEADKVYLAFHSRRTFHRTRSPRWRKYWGGNHRPPPAQTDREREKEREEKQLAESRKQLNVFWLSNNP